MRATSVRKISAALLVLGSAGVARAGDTAKASASPAAATQEDAGVGLLDAARAGQVDVQAQGAGGPVMTVRVTNKTNRKLKVVLPPGLVASGATGQMGGMGGMGGGMGGMGGGMGGMGGGMGGGGMGGGMGGMGGGMGGGGMLTMPATMGMMMLGRLIMTLVEPTESWNPASLMSGMMGGGMGGMGGGMGGMGGGMGGGGMMGGMGGGFRSVPPTQLPNATLAPGQTRELATRIVNLGAPGADGQVSFPQQGEPLQLGDASDLQGDPRVAAALRRLAQDKAPSNVAQLVLWAAAGMNWADVARLSHGWANPQELALAKQLVAQLDADKAAEGDAGRLLVEVTAKADDRKADAGQLAGAFRDRTMLGLAVESTVPARPSGPAVACKVQLQGTAEKPEALVQVAASDADAQNWAPVGKFTLPVARDAAGKLDAAAFGDALAEELVKRLVKVVVTRPSANSGGLIPKTPREREKSAYTVRIDNYSPLMLNGIALSGAAAKADEPLKVLAGISLSPRRSLALPVSGEAAEAFGLKAGARVMALDLSGL